MLCKFASHWPLIGSAPFPRNVKVYVNVKEAWPYSAIWTILEENKEQYFKIENMGLSKNTIFKVIV